MKKHKPPSPFPISQRKLADYLGVSVTLLNMTKTGRHGARELKPATSQKMTKLMEAHILAEKPGAESQSGKKIKDGSPGEYRQLAKDLLEEATFLNTQANMLKRRLDKMVETGEETEHWIRTIDTLLAPRSHVKQSGRDRQWLEAQKAFALIGLEKNGFLAQLNLETQIETKKAKARIYIAAHKKLMSKVNSAVKGVKVEAGHQATGNDQNVKVKIKKYGSQEVSKLGEGAGQQE